MSLAKEPTMTPSPDEQWTAEQVAEFLGLASATSARSQLSKQRWNVPAIGHAPGPKGGLVAVWSANDVRAAADQRPGRGGKAEHRPERRPGLDPLVLRRLLAVELAGVPPLPEHLWLTLARLLHGTVIDTVWVEQPGELIAQEVEDATGEEEEFPPEDGSVMSAAARSWTRVQALAVIDALLRGDLAGLRIAYPPATTED